MKIKPLFNELVKYNNTFSLSGIPLLTYKARHTRNHLKGYGLVYLRYSCVQIVTLSCLFLRCGKLFENANSINSHIILKDREKCHNLKHIKPLIPFCLH